MRLPNGNLATHESSSLPSACLYSGVPVMGTSWDVPAILDKQLVSTLLVSSTTNEERRLREVAQACKERGVTILQAEFQFRPLDQGKANRLRNKPSLLIPRSKNTR